MQICYAINDDPVIDDITYFNLNYHYMYPSFEIVEVIQFSIIKLFVNT